MVDDAVDHRRGDGLVAEDAAPGVEGRGGCEDQRGVFVAERDELEDAASTSCRETSSTVISP